MDRILDAFAAIYYPIFCLSCTILNTLLFYLILMKTSKVLKKMRWFLYPSNVINFVTTVLAFFLQFRNVNNHQSMALMCQGSCKYLGPQYCFHGYALILTVTTTSGILNLHMLYYRMVNVKYLEQQNVRVLVFCLWYLFSLLVMTLCYIPPADVEFVYQETVQNHPEYDFELYGKFGGFANSHNITATMLTLTLVVLATTGSFLGIYWRKEALKILDKSQKSLSEHTALQFKTLIQGLSFQIMLPFICYVPMAFFYVFNKYSGTQIIISQYTIGMMMTLPAALDPILQISFIVPYRNAVKSMIFCKNDQIESNSQNNTLWQHRKSSHVKTTPRIN